MDRLAVRTFLAGALVVSLLPAQTKTLVSPVGTATVEGSINNVAPFGQALARRYVQIHSDLGVPVMFITKLSFRRDRISSAATTGTRTVDLEMNMGNAVPWNQIHYMMSANFPGAKTNVVARKLVTLGPSSGTGAPAPFDMAILLDAPYVHIGAASLGWEALVYGITTSGSVPSAYDADTGSTTTGTTTITGAGCIASSQTSRMIHSTTVADVCGAFSFGGFVDYGPPNAPTVLYVGTASPSTSLPGLCSPLYTDMLLALPLGSTDATGYLGSFLSGNTRFGGGPFAFVLPNTFPAAVLTTQVHSLDVGSTNLIPVANSDGRSFTVPASNTSKVVAVSRAYNDVGGTTAEAAKFGASGFVGYALVTEFTYF